MYRFTIGMLAALGLSVAGQLAHGAVLLEDGEGTSASLNAKYAKTNTGLRAAQITDVAEGAIPAQSGSGSAKFVYQLNTSNFQAEFTQTLGSAVDASSVSTGALEFGFYYNGINFADRSQGKTIRTFQLAIGSTDSFYHGFSVAITTDDVTTIPGLLSNEWNLFHIELDDSGHFTSAGSTVNGTPLTIGGLSDLAIDPGDIDWTNVKSVLFSTQHGGASAQIGPFEGFFGIDDMQLVPEPASLALIGLGMGSLLSRRKR